MLGLAFLLHQAHSLFHTLSILLWLMLHVLSSAGYHPGDAVMASLCNAVRSKLPDFTSQNISNTVRSHFAFLPLRIVYL